MVYYNKKTKTWAYDGKTKGSRKHIRGHGYKTRDEALEAELKAKGDPSSQLNKIFLYDLINRRLKEVRLYKKISTYDKLYSVYKCHIYNKMPNKRLDKISKNDINEHLRKLSEEGCSNNTVNGVISFLKTAFNYAVNNDLLIANPMNGISYKDHKKKEIQYLTYDEFKLLEKAEEDITYRTYWIVSFYLGIRKSERVIRWNKVDFINKCITIDEHIYEGGGKGNVQILSGRKNNTGITIALNEHTIEALKQLKEYDKQFDGYSENSYVFGVLSPISRSSIKRHLDDAVKRAGIKKHITPHSMRHAMVSACYQAGIPTQIIAYRIGDTPEQVQKTYGHLQDKADMSIVDYFNKLDKK